MTIVRGHDNYWENIKLAEDPNTSVEVLDELSNIEQDWRTSSAYGTKSFGYDFQDEDIVSKVALNPNTSVETLNKLSKMKLRRYNILAYLVQNPNTPIKILDKLSKMDTGKGEAKPSKTPYNEYIDDELNKNSKWSSLKEAGLLDVAAAASKYLNIL